MDAPKSFRSQAGLLPWDQSPGSPPPFFWLFSAGQFSKAGCGGRVAVGSRWGEMGHTGLCYVVGHGHLREAQKEGLRGLGCPYKVILCHVETRAEWGPFPSGRRLGEAGTASDFEGSVISEHGESLHGEAAGCLQGLVWNFAFHVKLVTFTRHRLFEFLWFLP